MDYDRVSLEDCQRHQPLSVLQLDTADRVVLRVAGRGLHCIVTKYDVRRKKTRAAGCQAFIILLSVYFKMHRKHLMLLHTQYKWSFPLPLHNCLSYYLLVVRKNVVK